MVFLLTLTVVAVLPATRAAAIPLPGPPLGSATTATTVPVTVYDARAEHSPTTRVAPRLPDGVPSLAARQALSQGNFSRHSRDLLAAETAGDVETAISRSDLADSQASNFARYSKKLPSGAQDPVITRGANGSVQFSADVPGRVPGSYATYTKVGQRRHDDRLQQDDRGT